jgi:hypothetical protein
MAGAELCAERALRAELATLAKGSRVQVALLPTLSETRFQRTPTPVLSLWKDDEKRAKAGWGAGLA